MTSKMVQRSRAIVLMAVIVPVLATGLAAAPRQPGWSNRIIVTGPERAAVRSTPIEMRPYRPLHVYGNTVRRRHYHGGIMPAQSYVAPRNAAPSVVESVGVHE